MKTNQTELNSSKMLEVFEIPRLNCKQNYIPNKCKKNGGVYSATVENFI